MKKRTYSFYVEVDTIEEFLETFNASESTDPQVFSDQMRRAMQNAVKFHKNSNTCSESEQKVLQKLKELQAYRLQNKKTKQTDLYKFFKELMVKLQSETFFSFPKNFIQNL